MMSCLNVVMWLCGFCGVFDDNRSVDEIRALMSSKGPSC